MATKSITLSALGFLILTAGLFVVRATFFPSSAQQTASQCSDTPPPPNASFVFASSKSHVTKAGETVDLIWSINSGQGTCRALDGFNLEASEQGAEGKKTITILNPIHYFSLSCADESGKDLGTSRVCVDIEEGSKAGDLPVIIFKSSQHSISKEKTPVTLNWTVKNAASCKGIVQSAQSKDGEYANDPKDTEWTKAQSANTGTAIVHPDNQYSRYLLSCTTSVGKELRVAQDIAIVTAAPPIISSFTANGEQSATVEKGATVTLQWKVDGADSCEGMAPGVGRWLDGWDPVNYQPFLKVNLLASADYTLRCIKRYTYEGEAPIVAEAVATVHVGLSGPTTDSTSGKPQETEEKAITTVVPQTESTGKIVSFTATDASGRVVQMVEQAGDPVTLSWDAVQVKSCISFSEVLASGNWINDSQNPWASSNRELKSTFTAEVKNTTRYTLLCVAPGTGTLEKKIVVTVAAVTPIEIKSFTERVESQRRVLVWESDGDACTLSRLLDAGSYPITSQKTGTHTHSATGETMVSNNSGTYKLECWRLSRPTEKTAKDLPVKEILGTLIQESKPQSQGAQSKETPVVAVSLAEQRRLTVIADNSANYRDYANNALQQAEKDGTAVDAVVKERGSAKGMRTQNLDIFGHGTDNLTEYGARRIFSSGPPGDEKLDILFLGVSDYFTDDEVDEFARIATHRGFQMYTPFREYMPAINVNAINLSQVQSDPFQAAIVNAGNFLTKPMVDLINKSNVGTEYAFSYFKIATAAKNFFGVDEVILLSGEKFRAFAPWGWEAIISTSVLSMSTPGDYSKSVNDWPEHQKNVFADYIVHEFGHSFGGLIDEYLDGLWDNPGDPNCIAKTVAPWDTEKYVKLLNEWGSNQGKVAYSYTQSGSVPVRLGRYEGCGWRAWNYRPTEYSVMQSKFLQKNDLISLDVFFPFGAVSESWLREKLAAYSFERYSPKTYGCGDVNQWACGRMSPDTRNGTICMPLSNTGVSQEDQGNVCRSCGGKDQMPCDTIITPFINSSILNGVDVSPYASRYCRAPYIGKDGMCKECPADTNYSFGECFSCGKNFELACLKTEGTVDGCFLPFKKKDGKCLTCNESEEKDGASSPKISIGPEKQQSFDGTRCIDCGYQNQAVCTFSSRFLHDGCYDGYTSSETASGKICVDCGGKNDPICRYTDPRLFRGCFAPYVRNYSNKPTCMECDDGSQYDKKTHRCASCGDLLQLSCKGECRTPFLSGGVLQQEDCTNAKPIDDNIPLFGLDGKKLTGSALGERQCRNRNQERIVEGTCVSCPAETVRRANTCERCGGSGEIMCDSYTPEYIGGCKDGLQQENGFCTIPCGKDGEPQCQLDTPNTKDGCYLPAFFNANNNGKCGISNSRKSYRGCFMDSEQRTLPHRLYYERLDSLSVIDKCIAAAYAKGYRFAGVQNGNECWAGSTYPNAVLVSAEECNQGCESNISGGRTEWCGGQWRNSIYQATNGLIYSYERGETKVLKAGIPATLSAGNTATLNEDMFEKDEIKRAGLSTSIPRCMCDTESAYTLADLKRSCATRFTSAVDSGEYCYDWHVEKTEGDSLWVYADRYVRTAVDSERCGLRFAATCSPYVADTTLRNGCYPPLIQVNDLFNQTRVITRCYSCQDEHGEWSAYDEPTGTCITCGKEFQKECPNDEYGRPHPQTVNGCSVPYENRGGNCYTKCGRPGLEICDNAQTDSVRGCLAPYTRTGKSCIPCWRDTVYWEGSCVVCGHEGEPACAEIQVTANSVSSEGAIGKNSCYLPYADVTLVANSKEIPKDLSKDYERTQHATGLCGTCPTGTEALFSTALEKMVCVNRCAPDKNMDKNGACTINCGKRGLPACIADNSQEKVNGCSAKDHLKNKEGMCKCADGYVLNSHGFCIIVSQKVRG
ncbi:hypothetical protein HY627_01075 [Candidatus Uhrbacteria bacterium]|nr:hypothetical protein [Candidatus Uhrbacteria bacterium]